MTALAHRKRVAVPLSGDDGDDDLVQVLGLAEAAFEGSQGLAVILEPAALDLAP